jgi:peptidoglycan hydrolase-like protein with peptidoglycan-binding domain
LGRRSLLATVLLVCFAAPLGAWPQTKKPASKKTQASATKPTTKKSSRKRRTARVRGQQAINKERVKEIQTALIREGYLTGKPDGAWDDRTKKALARLQEENGWQSKVVPDSRALIKLGLGPNRAGLLNPESIQPSSDSEPGATEGTPQ